MWMRTVGILVPSAVVMAVSIMAASTHSVETAREPGAVDEVDGPALDYRLRGSGPPTVVFVSGANAPQAYWGDIPSSIAERAATVTFDRAGFGASEPGPAPRHAGRIAQELRNLLDRIDAPRPYVVVAHSFGCVFARVFAGAYPSDVAGMILLDPGHKEMLAGFAEHLEGRERQEWIEYWDGIWARYEGRTDATALEIQAVDHSLRLQRASVLDPDLRLLVVSALDPAHASPFVGLLSESSRQAYFRYLERHHEEIAALTERGERITALGTGHMIPIDRPDLVVDLVNQVLDEVGR